MNDTPKPDASDVQVAVAQPLSMNGPADTSDASSDEEPKTEEGLNEDEAAQALSILDSDADDNGVLEIFSGDCLKCSALVPHVKELEKIKPKKRDCHYTKGNERCPASSAKIMIYIDVEGPVRRFKMAHEAQDSATLAKLYAKLATRSEYEQSKINARLAEVLSR